MDARLKRMKFRAWHRGFKEADLILGHFADQHLETLNPQQINEFEKILEAQDQDLYAWITGKTPTPPEYDNEVMGLIKSFRYFAKTLWADKTSDSAE